MFPFRQTVVTDLKRTEFRPGRLTKGWSGWGWLAVVWLASARAAAQGATLPPGPAVEGPLSPADEAAARSAAEAARVEQEREGEQTQQIAALRAQLQALQAQVQADRQAQGATRTSLAAQLGVIQKSVSDAPPAATTAGWGVSLTGYVQADWGVYNQLSQDQLSPSGSPLNQTEVFIRRARLRAAIERPWVAGLVEFDGNTVNGPQARIIGAEASVKLPPKFGEPVPLLMATIGLFKIPFGFEVGQSDRDRLFLERSTAEHGLFPGEYDAGARLMGGWRFVRYVFAIMDGEPIGERSFPLHDPNRAKDFVGRLGVDTPISSSVWLSGGFSALSGTGFHAGTAATKTSVQWVDLNGNGVLDSGEIQVIPGSAALPSSNFSRFGYGADLRLGVDEPALGSSVLYGEVYWAKNLDRGILPADPAAFGRDYRELGLYVGITQDLGPHATVGVRYDFYNPDADSVNHLMGATLPTAFAYQTVAFAAQWGSSWGRLVAEFDLNRNKNGRDLEGNPANLASNAFFLRGQVGF